MRIREVTGKEVAVLFPVSVLKWGIYADLWGCWERNGGSVPNHWCMTERLGDFYIFFCLFFFLFFL